MGTGASLILPGNDPSQVELLLKKNEDGTYDRPNLIYIAKLCEQAERYDEMVFFMKEVAKTKIPLNVEERNLLSVAYKNVIGSRRASWRILHQLQNNEETAEGGASDKVQGVKTMSSLVAKEIFSLCLDVVEVIDQHFAENAEDAEANVFFEKMKGDYYRYMAEVGTDGVPDIAGIDPKDKASKSYEKAQETAVTGLPATHPIRLGLALNYSVFIYEILGEHEPACKLAKKAFDAAIAELDQLPEDSYKDATLIMQLLRDNLTLWTTGEEETA